MEIGHRARRFNETECGCCLTDELFAPGSEEFYSCQDRQAVFTKREQRVLKRIREAGLQARNIKRQLTELKPDQAGYHELKEKLEKELEELRRVRAELETERVAAAEERMRLLGHG